MYVYTRVLMCMCEPEFAFIVVDICGVSVIVWKYLMDEVVCISYLANALWQGMNATILSPVMSK